MPKKSDHKSETPYNTFTLDYFSFNRAITQSFSELKRDISESQKEYIIKIRSLNTFERAVLSALLSARNINYYQCNPSLKTLADNLMSNPGNISRALKKLRDIGLIHPTRVIDENGGIKTIQYWLMYDIEILHEAFDDIEKSDFIQMYFPLVHETYCFAFNK